MLNFTDLSMIVPPCVFGLANNIMVWIKMLDTGLTHLLGSIMRHSDSFKSKGLVAVPVGNEPSKCRLYISIIKEKKEAHWDFCRCCILACGRITPHTITEPFPFKARFVLFMYRGCCTYTLNDSQSRKRFLQRRTDEMSCLYNIQQILGRGLPKELRVRKYQLSSYFSMYDKVGGISYKGYPC